MHGARRETGSASPSAGFVRDLAAGRPRTVVVYGTSLTAEGRWAVDLRAWLETRFPGLTTFHNAGMSGRASNTGLARLDERVLAKKPDVVFVEFAMNDAFSFEPGDPDRGISVERSFSNLGRMIDAIRFARPGCEVVLQTMNPAWDAPNGRRSGSRREKLDTYYAGYRAMAAERGLVLADHNPRWTRLRENRPDVFAAYIPDGTHPTDEGSSAITTPTVLRLLGAGVEIVRPGE